ncbi:Retrovirus-related Pol polyprotein from transposon 17.6 [Stylophora pistillata]|uniref:Retrovirus-related Pol polyprotein from transposon 17.6 n=1 Tax=Stylophora pistillata TaxID=50429 RepID=A0A2B4S652_STYPI|nr:Retrovirus-related Pol polyprotein from transposon 17.6 [Stylophora pistillata]
MKTIDEVSADLHGGKYFMLVDAKSGYWMVELDNESSLLTTFNTPWGKDKWLCLPFGLKVSADVFQERLNAVLKEVKGITGCIDNILTRGVDSKDHDVNLLQLLETAGMNRIKFNPKKLQFKTTKCNFFGPIITPEGMKSDDKKVEAIKQMKTPKDKKALQSFQGMINYLKRYSAKLTRLFEPLRPLLWEEMEWTWDSSHQDAFNAIKEEFSRTPILTYFDQKAEHVIQTDASMKGLGAVLLQEGKPVIYVSRTLTPAEERYSNIERELLGVVFAMERLHNYVYANEVQLDSPYGGTNVTVSLHSSVTFKWTFSGGLLEATWATKRKDALDIDQVLMTIGMVKQQIFNVSLYNGRVNGSWNGKSPGQVSFTLSPIKEVDNRFFLCIFKPIDFGVLSTKDTVQLIVQDPPMVTFKTSILPARRGVPARLTCNASGFPDPKISWMRQTGPTESEIDGDNGNYQINSQPGSSELILKKTMVNDQGYYLCKASNFKSDVTRAYIGVLFENLREFANIISKETIQTDKVMISFDVKSLFANLPIEEAVQAMLHRLNDPSLPDRTALTPTQVTDLLNFVLRSSYFKYNGALYKRQEGAPMGSPISAVMANLYMEAFKERTLATAPEPPRI